MTEDITDELVEMEVVRCVHSKSPSLSWVWYSPENNETRIPFELVSCLYENRYSVTDFSELKVIEYGPYQGHKYPAIQIEWLENAVNPDKNELTWKIEEIETE